MIGTEKIKHRDWMIFEWHSSGSLTLLAIANVFFVNIIDTPAFACAFVYREKNRMEKTCFFSITCIGSFYG